MVKVDIREHTHRPVDEVFEQLVDIEAYPEWMPEGGVFVDCAVESDGPIGEGTRYTDRTRYGTVRGEITEFERPTRVVFHYTARIMGYTAIEGWPAYDLAPDGQGGTRIHHHGQVRLHGPFRLLAPLIQRIADAERRRTVDALIAVLERDG